MVLERREAGDIDWVGVWFSDRLPVTPRFLLRDYGLFQKFGVRGHTESGVIYPRNLPRDVSRLAWISYMRCPTDYHSASHCTIEEFCNAYMEANPNDKDVRPEHAAYDIFRLWVEGEDEEYRLVFWFDN